MNNQNYFGVGFVKRVHTNTVGVNYYFGTRRTNRPPPTPNYGQVNKKYNMEYYSKSCYCTENLSITITIIEFSGLQAVKDTEKFNHNYMELVGCKQAINYCLNQAQFIVKQKNYIKSEYINSCKNATLHQKLALVIFLMKIYVKSLVTTSLNMTLRVLLY